MKYNPILKLFLLCVCVMEPNAILHLIWLHKIWFSYIYICEQGSPKLKLRIKFCKLHACGAHLWFIQMDQTHDSPKLHISANFRLDPNYLNRWIDYVSIQMDRWPLNFWAHMEMIEITVGADFLQREGSHGVLKISPSPSPCGSPGGPHNILELTLS